MNDRFGGYGGYTLGELLDIIKKLEQWERWVLVYEERRERMRLMQREINGRERGN